MQPIFHLIFFAVACLNNPVFGQTQSYGPIQHETLRDVATQYSYNSVYTIEQWMVAIWQDNIDSFESQNIFALKPQVSLSIPSESAVGSIQQELASTTIQDQLNSWQSSFRSDSQSEYADMSTHYANKEYTVDAGTQPVVAKKATLLDRVLLSLLRGTHFVQHRMQSLVITLFDRHFIPMIIISSGLGLLSCTLWFAYLSAKRDDKTQVTAARGLKKIDSNKSSPLAPHSEDSSDFNVFSTNEGIPIKLDLARAYINMQDMDSARRLLEEIVSLHPGKIASEAKILLSEIS